MNEDLSTADDAQLSRWAYGRPGTTTEADRARYAAIELERRSTAATTPPALGTRHASTPSSAPAAPVTSGDADGMVGNMPEVENLDVAHRHEPHPGRRRLIVVASVLGIAVIAGAMGLPALIGPNPPTPTSLDIFDRQVSNEERELLALLQSAGQRVSIGPRVLGTTEFATILAYRSIHDEPGPPERDQVCVAVAELDRAVQSRQISDWQCINRADFENEGSTVTLFGLGGHYDVDWGPRGGAQLDVFMTEAQRIRMDPGFQAVFVDNPATELDESYLSGQPLQQQTGLVVESLRTIFPLAMLVAGPDAATSTDPPADAEWVAAYIGAPAESSDRMACLAVVAAGVQSESRCIAVAEVGERGLLLEIVRDGRRVLVSWSPTGEISAQTG